MGRKESNQIKTNTCDVTWNKRYLVLYIRTSHRLFKAGYKTQTYSLHQKDTSLSEKAVAPSQFDLSLVGRSNTNPTTTSKGSSYTRLIVVIHSYCYCFSFETKCRTFCAQP